MGDEDSLLDCRIFSTVGVATCDHSREAGVRCIGKVLDSVTAHIIIVKVLWFQNLVLKEMCGLPSGKKTSSLEYQSGILLMVRWLWAGLRCVLEVLMALCVMTPGTTKMPQWCADNLDSLLMVRACRQLTAVV